jgi:hypothetical protein
MLQQHVGRERRFGYCSEPTAAVPAVAKAPLSQGDPDLKIASLKSGDRHRAYERDGWLAGGWRLPPHRLRSVAPSTASAISTLPSGGGLRWATQQLNDAWQCSVRAGRFSAAACRRNRGRSHGECEERAGGPDQMVVHDDFVPFTALRGGTPARRSSASPPPLRAWFSQQHQPDAGAARPRESRSSCRLPVSRPARDCRRAFRWRQHAPAPPV